MEYQSLNLFVKSRVFYKVISCHHSCLVCFLSDLPASIKAKRTILYADDLAICSTSAGDAQITLNRLETYCDKKGLTMNTQKSKIIILRRATRIPEYAPLLYKGEQLEVVSNFNYLGILLQCSSWSFSMHVKARLEKAKTALLALNSRHKLAFLNFTTCMELYNSAIIPVATYGLKIFQERLSNTSWLQFNELDRVFIRKVAGLKKNTKNEFTNGVFEGWITLCCRLDRQGLYHTHTGNVRWGERASQGFNSNTERKWRDCAITNFINAKALKGKERISVCNFGYDGFHRKWCINEECYSTTDCLSAGTVCLLCCCHVNDDIYHLLKCCYVERHLVGGDINTSRRILRIWNFLNRDEEQ